MMKNFQILNNRLIFGLLLIAVSNNVTGQVNGTVPDLTAGLQTYRIDLETVLKLAGANNLSIKEFTTKHHLVTLDEKIAREWLIPDLFIESTLHNLNGSAMNSDGRYFRGVD